MPYQFGIEILPRCVKKLMHQCHMMFSGSTSSFFQLPNFYVIETYKEMAPHRPIWPSKNLGPHPLYPHPKPRWKPKYDIWFIIAPIGRNQLKLIMNTLTFDFSSLKNKVLSNKIERGIGITHMEEALVPCEHGMDVIGHRYPIFYGK